MPMVAKKMSMCADGFKSVGGENLRKTAGIAFGPTLDWDFRSECGICCFRILIQRG